MPPRKAPVNFPINCILEYIDIDDSNYYLVYMSFDQDGKLGGLAIWDK